MTLPINQIARVFPTRTSFSPDDEHAYFEDPPMNTFYEEVHISVTFTWSIPKAKTLYKNWSKCCDIIKMGGPAFGDPGDTFVAGKYLRKGITITSRGCPNKCPFCFVPKREGDLRELPIISGNIIQDNNILACSNSHLDNVFEMLKAQKQIEFKGGLEARRVTPKIAEKLRELRIKSLWLACDTPSSLPTVKNAITTLKKAGFLKSHIYCYVLIGNNMEEEKCRLIEIYNSGAMPFAQLYINDANDIFYSKKWKSFQRTWSRPAIIRRRMNPQEQRAGQLGLFDESKQFTVKGLFK